MVEQQGRWDDARSVLAGDPTAGAVLQRRRSLRRRIGFVVLAVVLPVLLAGLAVRLGLRLPHLDERPDRPGSETIALVLAGAGLCVETVGLVRLLRDRPGLAWSSPLTALTFGQRRTLARNVRRGRPVPADEHGLAVYLAERMQRQGPYLLMVLGFALMTSGRVLIGSLLDLVLAGLGLVFLVPGAVLLQRDRRLAARWLSRFGRAR